MSSGREHINVTIQYLSLSSCLGVCLRLASTVATLVVLLPLKDDGGSSDGSSGGNEGTSPNGRVEDYVPVTD